MTRRRRFEGQIVGVGTTSGVRLVVGHWERSPLGSFSDVMVERADGHRILLAPSEEVAGFVASTYTFDEVRIEPLTVDRTGRTWCVRSPSLRLEVESGDRTPLGWLLRLVPRRVATSTAWSTLTDPVARLLLRGVRTKGSAGQGRREYYGATDAHRVTAAGGRLEGQELGSLAPVDPPCRFGFSSTPRRPQVTEVTTTVVTS
ncbi:hypothetical protein [Nocardioides caldifontis]|uniref:hypothetical protein n=1 Tax=Nocardioides caldifontis TaxID=2588938 RepID=UPI001EF123F4|nr:hypothetical protein [Nocardioides caldifontis]